MKLSALKEARHVSQNFDKRTMEQAFDTLCYQMALKIGETIDVDEMMDNYDASDIWQGLEWHVEDHIPYSPEEIVGRIISHLENILDL